MAVNESLLKEKLLKEMELLKAMDYATKAVNKSEVATRQTQVARECVHLTNEIDKLHEIISKLDDRLVPIARYSDPEPEDVEKAESLVSHAEFIRGKAWLVSSAIERIDSILQRLEL